MRMVDAWTGRTRESIGEWVSGSAALWHARTSLATFAEVIAKRVNCVCERQQRRHGSRPATRWDRGCEPLADGKGTPELHGPTVIIG